eukprot:jgi/Mesvir1/9835/Mv22379-RA.1
MLIFSTPNSAIVRVRAHQDISFSPSSVAKKLHCCRAAITVDIYQMMAIPPTRRSKKSIMASFLSRELGWEGAACHLTQLVNSSRLQNMAPSADKELVSPFRGGVSSLSVDAVEQRYLLAGAVDSTVAVYDLHGISSASSLEERENDGNEGDPARGGARPGKGPGPGTRRDARSSGADGRGTTSWTRAHHPLFHIDRCSTTA